MLTIFASTFSSNYDPDILCTPTNLEFRQCCYNSCHAYYLKLLQDYQLHKGCGMVPKTLTSLTNPSLIHNMMKCMKWGLDETGPVGLFNRDECHKNVKESWYKCRKCSGEWAFQVSLGKSCWMHTEVPKRLFIRVGGFGEGNFRLCRF